MVRQRRSRTTPTEDERAGDLDLFASLWPGESGWDQIDFKRRIVRIESRTKSGRPHNLPPNDTVPQKLKEVRRKTGSGRYVSVHLKGKHAGHPVTDIKNAFNGAIDRAKIKGFRFHDLRHTFCSSLAIRGVPLNAIQKLAGHASINSTTLSPHDSRRCPQGEGDHIGLAAVQSPRVN